MKINRIILGLAAVLLIAAPAHALVLPLVPGTGWQEFLFDDVGSSWIVGGEGVAYSIDINESAFLVITDAFLPGDQFEVYNYAGSWGATSVPIIDKDLDADDDYYLASLDDRWSTALFYLTPGQYLVSGKVLASPFEAGRAALILEWDDLADTVVPEPATLITLGMGLLGGFGFRRKKI